MKKFLCAVLTVLLLIPSAFAVGEDMTFRLSGGSGKVGDTVTLVASVEKAPQTASFRVFLAYDESVLQPIEGKKLDVKGMFTANVKAQHEGKPVVNVLSVDARQVFAGDMDLFSVSFKIIGAPGAGTSSTPVEVVYEEFFDPGPTRFHPAIVSADIQVEAGVELPDDEIIDPDDPANGGDEDTAPPAKEPEKTPEEDNTNTGSAAPPAEDSKKPTGSWLIEGDDVYHVEENGETTHYKGEVTKDKDGNITQVDLTDDAEKPAGSLTVDGQVGPVLNVVEQDLDPHSGGNILLYVLIGLAVLLAAGAAAAFILLKKKKENKNEQ